MKKEMELIIPDSVKEFLNEMGSRPYPFNRSSAIVAQALSPYSGLSEFERVKVAQYFE